MWRFDSETDPGEWQVVEAPVSVVLRDVADSSNGPVAVGNKGYVIGRGADGWGVVVDDGPGAESNALHAVSSTDDGDRIWFAGANGALGYYDIPTGDREDHSEPVDMGTTFTSLTVAGKRGEEKFLIGDASGNVIPGDMDDGRTDWGWPSSPSGGTSIKDVTHDADGFGYAVDNNSNVYMTTEDDGWHRIGVDSGSSFYSIEEGQGKLLTGGGNAKVFELEEDDRFPTRGEYQWTPYDLGSFTVYGLDVGEHADLACGGSGHLYIRLDDGDWHRVEVDYSSGFYGVLASNPMVAVGDGGIIAERSSEDRWGGSDGSDSSSSSGSTFGDSSGSTSGDSSGSTSGDSTSTKDETSDTAEETDDDTTEGYDDAETSGSTSGSTDDGSTSDSTDDGSTSDDTSDDSTSGDSTSDDSTDDSTSSETTSDDSTSGQGDEEPSAAEAETPEDEDPIEEAYDTDEEVDADADEIEEDLDDDGEYDGDAGDQDVDMYEEDNDSDEVTDADADQYEEDLDANDSTGDPQNDPSDPADAPDDGQNDPSDPPDDGNDGGDPEDDPDEAG